KVPSKHIGYCGSDKESILHDLTHDFSDLDLAKSFTVAYENEIIIGAMGLDIDEDDLSAEVWGPFLRGESMIVLAENLFKKVLSYSDSEISLRKFFFFLNQENKIGKEFVLNLGGIEKGNHYILQAKRDGFKESNHKEIEKYETGFEGSFSKIHQLEFPTTYYNAKNIISRLNEHNQLLIIKNDSTEIKGYVYVEAEPEQGQGSIEYVAVSDKFRKQGIGTKLIQSALNHLFSYESIKGVTLSVEKENEKAIHLYEAAGFNRKHELIDLRMERTPCN
ncbi:GNAT family N-acetyltransferase, partial [Microvirga sp. 3-52]|nr:GNAT family N-acetyltransferase [Microvirga sp. 3-52]